MEEIQERTRTIIIIILVITAVLLMVFTSALFILNNAKYHTLVGLWQTNDGDIFEFKKDGTGIYRQTHPFTWETNGNRLTINLDEGTYEGRYSVSDTMLVYILDNGEIMTFTQVT